MAITPLGYRDGTVRLLDQRMLPGREEWVETRDWRAVVAAIQSLAVRGAPLIGAAGAYAVCLAAREFLAGGRFDALGRFEAAAGAIAEARPTAVNLAWAVARMRRSLERERDKAARHAAARETRIAMKAAPRRAGAVPVLEIAPERLIGTLELEAEAIFSEDAAACAAIGRHGAEAVCPNVKRPLRLLTHCNAGALATCGIGTALGVARALHAAGRLERVHAGETRPLGQGARLTAWELAADGIPVAVHVDGAAGALLASGTIDAVVTGADRVARNGDTANKIGTLALAVQARHFGVPFFVAAPASTFDGECADGRAIPIELRAPDELPAARGAEIFNPAFDVTSAGLITAFITDGGVVTPGEMTKYWRR